MKNQKLICILFFIIKGSFLFGGNSFISSVNDASSLSIGNALTGADFSYDTGILNPARMNQMKTGLIFLSNENHFSGNISRGIIAYRNSNFPLKFIFLHEGIYDIPNTRNALMDQNGDGILNGNERLMTQNISLFNQHRIGIIFQQSILWNQWSFGVGYNTIITSLFNERAYGFNIDLGIFRKWNSNFSTGMVINNISLTPITWSTGHKDTQSHSIFFGGSFTPILKYNIFLINLFFDGGLRISQRTLDDDFTLAKNGGILRYGIEINADDLFMLRIGRAGKGKIAMGVSISTDKSILNYTMSTINRWEANSTGHIFTLIFDIDILKKGLTN